MQEDVASSRMLKRLFNERSRTAFWAVICPLRTSLVIERLYLDVPHTYASNLNVAGRTQGTSVHGGLPKDSEAAFQGGIKLFSCRGIFIHPIICALRRILESFSE